MYYGWYTCCIIHTYYLLLQPLRPVYFRVVALICKQYCILKYSLVVLDQVGYHDNDFHPLLANHLPEAVDGGQLRCLMQAKLLFKGRDHRTFIFEYIDIRPHKGSEAFCLSGALRVMATLIHIYCTFKLEPQVQNYGHFNPYLMNTQVYNCKHLRA